MGTRSQPLSELAKAPVEASFFTYATLRTRTFMKVKDRFVSGPIRPGLRSGQASLHCLAAWSKSKWSRAYAA